MTPAIRTLIGIALAAGLAACQTSSVDTLAATDAGVNVAALSGRPSTLLSNPTNGGPAYIGALSR